LGDQPRAAEWPHVVLLHVSKNEVQLVHNPLIFLRLGLRESSFYEYGQSLGDSVPEVTPPALVQHPLGTHCHLVEEVLVVCEPLGLGTYGRVADEPSGWHQVRRLKPSGASHSSTACGYAVGEDSSWYLMRRLGPRPDPAPLVTRV
jgi:hypothetical protein